MDTTSLYYFSEAAKDLNFTQTANRLFLSQQNLSNHIARLESLCACKLFSRKPKLELTYEGELFLSYAKDAVASEGNIISALKSIQNEEAGELRIGATTPRASIFLPEILQAFRTAHPGVNIKLFDQPSYQLERLLADNKLDLCIGVIHPQSSELKSTHLLTDKVYFCASGPLLREHYGARCDALLKRAAAKGASIGDFSKIPVVMPADGIPLAHAIRSCYEEAGCRPNVLLSTTYPQFFRSLYFNGVAACFMTQMILSETLRNLPQGIDQFYALPLLLDGEPLQRNITLTVNCHRYLSKPALHFIELVTGLFTTISQEREKEGENPAL